MASEHYPPLLGDGKGRYRVHISGNSGSGKSTLAANLAQLLNVPMISMDRLHWLPGWRNASPEEFQASLRAAMDQPACQNGWVIEGNYTHLGGLVAYEECTDEIWIDPPLMLYLPRLILRTFYRLLGWEAPCSDGCQERLSEVFFSKDSIIWWCISNHWNIRRKMTARMAESGLGIGSDVSRRRMRRLGGWGEELRQWLQSVEDMVRRK